MPDAPGERALNRSAVAWFVTHPEVVIDPAVPVPDWPLSAKGIERMRRMLGQPWLSRVQAIFCSAEKKSVEAAHIIGAYLSVSSIVIEGLGENDRSATGYLPKAEFEAVANEFFACPAASVRGWERAIDAQRRVVKAVDQAIGMTPRDHDIAIVSHGGVGALLMCHLKGIPISRSEDQPLGGGGNVYSFDIATRRLLTGWHPIDGHVPAPE